MTIFKNLPTAPAKATTVVSGQLNNTTDPVTISVVDATNWPTANFWVDFWNKSLYPDPNDDPNLETILFTSRTGNTFSGGVRGALGTSNIAHTGTPDCRPTIQGQHFADIHTAITALEAATATTASPTYANLTLGNAGALRTTTTSGHTALIQAYDVDGAVYTTFATLTAGNTPTLDLSDSVTKAGQYIYRGGGTDVAPGDGGTGISTYALGDTLYSSAANTLAKLAGNTTTTRKFMRQTGDGVNSAAPAWDTLQAGDVPDLSATYQPLDSDLTAVAGLSTTGLIARTGAGASATRTLTGTADKIDVTNGDGVAGNPTITVAPTYVGQTSITTLGTIATGTWQGTRLGGAYAPILSDVQAPTASVAFNSQRATGLADPIGAQDAATKAWVSNYIEGLDVKGSVRCASTANLTLSGTQIIDGVAVIAGERVLAKNQTAPAENGIYVVAAGAWSRSSDADVSADVTSGMTVWVSEGTTLANTKWVLTTGDPITLGTTALTFTQFGSAAGAPVGSSYIVVALDGTLTNERRLQGTANQVVLTDGGAGGDLTLSAPQDIHSGASPTFAGLNLSTGGAVRTGTSAGNTLLLQARDVDGASWTTFATMTANNTPTLDLSTAVTQGGLRIGGRVVVTQTAHGFAVGDWLYVSATDTYAKAKADAASTCDVVGVVESVTDANTFVLAQDGCYVSVLSGLTAGGYVLSAATAGAMTATAPTTAGQFMAPLFVAVNATSGYVRIERPTDAGLASSGSAGDVVKVDAQSGSAASYTFTVPAGYKHLRLKWSGGGSGSCLIRFNSDTGTNYGYQKMYSFGGTGYDAYGASQTSGVIGELGTSASGIIEIPSYAGTSLKKTATGVGTVFSSAVAGTGTWTCGVGWENTGAITSITLLPGSGSWSNFEGTLYMERG